MRKTILFRSESLSEQQLYNLIYFPTKVKILALQRNFSNINQHITNIVLELFIDGKRFEKVDFGPNDAYFQLL